MYNAENPVILISVISTLFLRILPPTQNILTPQSNSPTVISAHINHPNKL